MYVTIRREYETKSCAVYVILGYDVNGIKDILGLWISESEGKHNWMQIFDELKGVCQVKCVSYFLLVQDCVLNFTVKHHEFSYLRILS